MLPPLRPLRTLTIALLGEEQLDRLAASSRAADAMALAIAAANALKKHIRDDEVHLINVACVTEECCIGLSKALPVRGIKTIGAREEAAMEALRMFTRQGRAKTAPRPSDASDSSAGDTGAGTERGGEEWIPDDKTLDCVLQPLSAAYDQRTAANLKGASDRADHNEARPRIAADQPVMRFRDLRNMVHELAKRGKTPREIVTIVKQSSDAMPRIVEDMPEMEAHEWVRRILGTSGVSSQDVPAILMGHNAAGS